MDEEDLWTAPNNGKKGSTWHIFKKSGEEYEPDESLCGKITEEKITSKRPRKPFNGVDVVPGIGRWCKKCKQFYKTRKQG